MKYDLSNMMALDVYLSSLSKKEYKEVSKNIEASIIKGTPLLCWDIYFAQVIKLNQQLEDKAYLENLLYKKTIAFRENLLDCLKKYDALVLTDIKRRILWVSNGFHSMTGYTVNEAIGKKPNFLQGEKTDKKTLEILHNHLIQHKSVTADLVNYRKEGTEYICQIYIEPVFKKKHEPVNFLAFEKEIVSP